MILHSWFELWAKSYDEKNNKESNFLVVFSLMKKGLSCLWEQFSLKKEVPKCLSKKYNV
jgi:hypothetical protein